MTHIPVLRDESILGLNIKNGDIVVDATLGGGGHTQKILEKHGDKIKLIGFDLDIEAKDRTYSKIKNMKSDFIFINDNFRNIDKALKQININKVDKILIDLGISSFQLDISKRGFSFLRNEKLLMTMKKNPGKDDITAGYIVNNWEEETLADIIFGFGEERYSKQIAKSIISSRKIRKIETTFDLVEIIQKAVGNKYRGLKIHPATRTFQALRIATNEELLSIEEVIDKGFNLLNKGGRLSIISFHSLEDRIVKRKFRELKDKGLALLINKKPIIPNDNEIKENPRSRSAKLRLLEKI